MRDSVSRRGRMTPHRAEHDDYGGTEYASRRMIATAVGFSPGANIWGVTRSTMFSRATQGQSPIATATVVVNVRGARGQLGGSAGRRARREEKRVRTSDPFSPMDIVSPQPVAGQFTHVGFNCPMQFGQFWHGFGSSANGSAPTGSLLLQGQSSSAPNPFQRIGSPPSRSLLAVSRIANIQCSRFWSSRFDISSMAQSHASACNCANVFSRRAWGL